MYIYATVTEVTGYNAHCLQFIVIENAHFSFLAEGSFASEAHCGCMVKWDGC